ncbi:MAG: DEAD/DEAH box helicase [Gammaproteobacteria bacterium]|nr:DEAD/DEAH box helicase [Gammaproteobacteria bacterium]
MPTTKPFSNLGLNAHLLSALAELGYEAPTPIQEQSIPVLMEGSDLLAQAQTGTGKTAAFALPVLSHLNIARKKPQALIITPTRELAIQVAEAFQSYAKHLKGFHVTPIYGGQDYQTQLRALKRGAHIIVGTPGRTMDHLRRGTLSLDALKTIVLDEADEMLKMGFIGDIEWILEQIPHSHQTALFSATIPLSIQKIAKRYLKEAKKIHIQPKKSSVDAIEQFYMCVARNQKLDALTRFLEVEEIQAAIIFTRTKNCSSELAEKLQARGYEASALNGDMNQSLRKKAIERIKSGSLDIIVATDVAARGIDVERISHVINFDIPHDTESYIHRIGRTGRAGRKGKALLFITPREYRLLNDIKRSIDSSIKKVEPPSLKEMNEKRSKQLAEKVIGVIKKSKKLAPYREIVESIIAQDDCSAKDIAAALAYLLQQSNPLPSQEISAAEPEFKKPRKKSPYTRGQSSERARGKKRPSSKTFSKASPGKRKTLKRKEKPRR